MDSPRSDRSDRFQIGQRIRFVDGHTFDAFDAVVRSIDDATGRILVVITIFDRETPVEVFSHDIYPV